MKKLFLIFTLLLSINTVSFSQIYIDNQGNIYDQTKKTNATSGTQTLKKQGNTGSGFQFDKSKLSIGGNLGLQFGDYTAINISPQVGYDFSKYFTAGVGLGYSYFKESHFNTKWTSSYLSFDLFGRFYPIDFLVLSVQPEISRMWQTIKTNGINYSENKFVPSFLVGGGLRYGGVIAMIQYDVIQDDYSPYGDNLVYTIGYTFNF
ncbi:hypothetical protein JGH11_18900 [Dysgonomonas sp. Marseille-P4677]|uniref:hypothetical protein n=1 Tax=Dysgonomonas sp. Marseille-P4677 TaxID=2364790 RepID=UPI0019121AE6|nr:hypothetical protein [Dysgonomonas sp. Marseille-P4677]MBK5722942.1 hypothetical protein [Dysgonomonas sp. Marseille-P4677]